MIKDMFGNFAGTYEERRSLANLSCFLLVQPPRSDTFLADAEKYCREKMPYSQVFRCERGGIQEVLEKVPVDGDLYVYLHGGVNKYAPPEFAHSDPITFVHKRNYNAFCLSLPVEDFAELDTYPDVTYGTVPDLTDTVFSRCRSKYMQLPHSGHHKYNDAGTRVFTREVSQFMVVLGCATQVAAEPEEVYRSLQMSVKISLGEQIIILGGQYSDIQFRGRGPSSYQIARSNAELRYAHVLEDKRRVTPIFLDKTRRGLR